MMTELCAELRNYFIHSDDDIVAGEFTVSGGNIDPLSLTDGEYIRIVGSKFNDGVWQYDETKGFDGMKDETFTGAVWLMSVPPIVEALAADIAAWQTKNADIIESPYQSESFAGYSYSLKSGNGSGAASSLSASSWQAVFASRLKPWYRRSERI